MRAIGCATLIAAAVRCAIPALASAEGVASGFTVDPFASPGFGPSALVTATCEEMAAPATAPEALASPGAALASPLALARVGTLEAERPARRSMAGRPHLPPVLDVGRARMLLRSLTVPGWGQASVGARKSGAVFLIAEAGIWGSFTAFRIQQQLRRDASEKTAQLFAGIDLSGRSEEFRRIVGAFISSEEYNRLVVRRDAANLYYGDPAAYEAYVAAHELKGSNSWSWDAEESFDRYRAQRKSSQKAGLRANSALAVAVANRIVSAIHAARIAGKRPAASAPAHSWNLEFVPVEGEPTAFHLGVRTRF